MDDWATYQILIRLASEILDDPNFKFNLLEQEAFVILKNASRHAISRHSSVEEEWRA